MDIDEIRAIPDPAARVAAVNAAIAATSTRAAALSQVTRETVRSMHDDGLTYAEIGAVLGVTRARAHALAMGVRPSP